MREKYDPVTGIVRQPIYRILIVGFLFFGVLAFGVTIFPAYSADYMYASVIVGGIGLAGLVWIHLNPNLYARFFINIGISGLSTMIAWRAFGYLFPNMAQFGKLLIFTIVLLAHVLPMWMPGQANVIRNELVAPKTKIGKAMHNLFVLLIPIAGILSASVTMFLSRNNKTASLSALLLLIFLFIATIMPYSIRFPSSPWESKRSSNK
jgi:hypothetical protein